LKHETRGAIERTRVQPPFAKKRSNPRKEGKGRRISGEKVDNIGGFFCPNINAKSRFVRNHANLSPS